MICRFQTAILIIDRNVTVAMIVLIVIPKMKSSKLKISLLNFYLHL